MIGSNTKRHRAGRGARRWSLAVAAAVLAAGVGVDGVRDAHADISVSLKMLDPPPPDDKNKNPMSYIRAVIKGAAQGLDPEKFSIRQETVEPAVTLPADDVRDFADSGEKLTMVVLVQGDERWMGNETYISEDDSDRLVGAFTGVVQALEGMSSAGPPGTSQAALLIYTAGKAEAKLELSPIEQLTGSLGNQQAYAGKIGVPLVVGLAEAGNVLAKQPGRRVLIVIGDGTGQKEDIGADLGAQIKRLKELEAEVYSIHYESVPSDNPVGQTNMKQIGYTMARKAESRDNFPAFAKAFVEDINARYYVTFPHCKQGKPPLCLTFDGQTHDFVVIVGEDESEPFSLQTPIEEGIKPPEETSLWWLWLLIVLVVIILIVVIVKKLSGREEIYQPPPQEMDMPMEPAPPPPPQAPAKTQMFNLGGQEGGIPIVGWIVPIDGPNRFQTFKLMQGVTKIGSGPEANIVIDDGFMSSQHAEFVMSPSGFMLKDGGSTNGTYVNERRVKDHELVDNDVFRMGKTNFKFKSIN